jgi:hypothetical protein
MAKRNIVETSLFNSQPMSSDFVSRSLEPEDFFTLSMTFTWAGVDANTGTILIEVCDEDGDWNETQTSSSYTISGSEGVKILKYKYIDFRYLRVSYTANTVTTGLLTCECRLYGERD